MPLPEVGFKEITIDFLQARFERSLSGRRFRVLGVGSVPVSG